MSDYFTAVPPAVATIVAALGPALLSANISLVEREERIVAFTDRLTRTFAQALLDKQAGK